MTDNEIIKALECCIGGYGVRNCDNCPNMGYGCIEVIPRIALDLITRQKARIKELENELQQSEQEADITETVLEERNKDIYDLISKERSNAILEFAEALKQEADNYVAGDDFVTVDEIDSLVKEMTEVEE